MRAIRNGLQGAGIPVENSKGEWGPGQEEINVRYADALEMADRHVIIKNGVQGDRARCRARRSPSWRSGATISPAQLSHIHASLWDAAGKTPLFHDAKAEHGMSALMRQLRRRAARLRARDHLFPRALHQLLQALPGRHLRADQGGVEPRQPHRRLPPVRRGQQGDPHRVPHRRRRPQSLSRLRRAARRGPRRHRGETRAGAGLSGDAYHGAKLREVPKTLREATDAAGNRKCCARRSAMPSSITTSTPRSGSSSNTTAGSPTGS